MPPWLSQPIPCLEVINYFMLNIAEPKIYPAHTLMLNAILVAFKHLLERKMVIIGDNKLRNSSVLAISEFLSSFDFSLS